MPTIKKEVGGTIHVIGYKEGDHFIAHCLEFDLVSEGTSPEKAKDNLADLIFSYLQFAMEKNIAQFAYHPAPKVYWDKFEEIRRKKIPKPQFIDPTLLKIRRNQIKDSMQEVKIKETLTHA
ncbi:MAG: hypothetical protein U9O41_00930 [Candidatus Aerophobetes bacterium]|nr:hypothetical protein [Candidatus Aerophobetes bacterium]